MSPAMQLTVRAQSAPWNESVEFLVMTEDRKRFGQPITISPVDSDVLRIEPTFRLSQRAAQTLIDDLWQAGLRPTEGTGSAGALAATQRHLEDMRALVFGKGNQS